MTQIIQSIVEELTQKQIVPFIGSGFSTSAGWPSASSLAKTISEEFKHENIEATDAGDLQKMAVKYETRFSRARLASLLEKALGHTTKSRLTVAHVLLARLVKTGLIKTIVTTNYDTALEDACKLVGVKVRVVSQKHHLSLRQSDDESIILKIHGDFGVPEQLVITQDDFASWCSTPQRQPLITKVRDLLANKSMLFLGYSLSDANILRELFQSTSLGSETFPRIHFMGVHRESEVHDASDRFRKYNIRVLHVPDLDDMLSCLFTQADPPLEIAHLVFNYPKWFPNMQCRYGGIETFYEALTFGSRHHHTITTAYTEEMLRGISNAGLPPGSPTYPSSYFFFKAAARAAVNRLLYQRENCPSVSQVKHDKGRQDESVPDVVHIHFLPLASLADEEGFPTLCTSHSLLSTDFYYGRGSFDGNATQGCKYELNAIYEAELSAALNLPYITALTNSHAQELQDIGAPVVRVMPAPLRVDEQILREDKSRARSAQSLADKNTILYVGRPDRRKGIEVLLGACELLTKSTDFQLVFVGAGLTLKGAELQVGDGHVRYDVSKLQAAGVKILPVSAANANAVMSYYRAADVLVVPSLYEPMGYVVLEAMAAACPVVASRTGGIKELVTDGYNGLMFEPGDFKQLSTLLLRILTDTDLRESLIENGRKTHNQRMPHAEVVKTWDRLYSEVGASVGILTSSLDQDLKILVSDLCKERISELKNVSLYTVALAGCEIAKIVEERVESHKHRSAPFNAALFKLIAASLHKQLRLAQLGREISARAIYGCMADVNLAFLNGQYDKTPLVLHAEKTSDQLQRMKSLETPPVLIQSDEP